MRSATSTSRRCALSPHRWTCPFPGLRVATFYHLFMLKRRAGTPAFVCRRHAATIKGAGGLVDAVEHHFGVKPGETTGDDRCRCWTGALRWRLRPRAGGGDRRQRGWASRPRMASWRRSGIAMNVDELAELAQTYRDEEAPISTRCACAWRRAASRRGRSRARTRSRRRCAEPRGVVQGEGRRLHGPVLCGTAGGGGRPTVRTSARSRSTATVSPRMRRTSPRA